MRWLGRVGDDGREVEAEGKKVPCSRGGRSSRTPVGINNNVESSPGRSAKSVTESSRGRMRIIHSAWKVKDFGAGKRVRNAPLSAMDDYAIR